MAEADNVGLGHKIEMSSPNLSMMFPRIFIESKTSFWSKYSNRILAQLTGGKCSHSYLSLANSQKLLRRIKFGHGTRNRDYFTLDSSWATSSRTRRWACSSCWGLARSRSVVKFWSSQGARWCRASRGKWSPDHTSEQLKTFYMI